MFLPFSRGIAAALVLLSLTVGTRATEDPSTEPLGADPSLKRFVRDVALSNPDVMAASAVLDASGALRDAAARPLYNPELSAQTESSVDDARTLGISQTLDWSGKRQAREDAAERERLIAQSQYRLSLWTFSTQLLTRLAMHQTAMERDQLARQAERVMNEFAELAEKRFTAGDINQVDLSLARLAATDAQIQRATRAGDLAGAGQAVRALAVDAPPSAWPQLLTPPPLKPDKNAREPFIHDLPEVRIAQERVQLADARVAVRRKAQRPDPTLTLRGGEQAGESLIGLNLSIPLFVRNSFDNEVRAALAARSEAQYSSDAVLQRSAARLRSAQERYELLRDAWATWERAGQPSLMLQTEQLRQLWQAGEISTTDYLVQLRQTIEVQDNAFALRQALWEGWFEWLRSSGQINEWLALDQLLPQQ